eukprot:CAMPEP_0180753058 /NCGR_PEP_ID=MMETSP1038_2-20121128/32474_1 /TAXON_ID=632150 /ORGANISM="Azadinium spinosum, Strain 3D9" /LENGTH=119 /DNA_ID=CAMNT_0022786907 /DNA_START=216 /DNA_END=572 /DNA_ORIENTATION=+
MASVSPEASRPISGRCVRAIVQVRLQVAIHGAFFCYVLLVFAGVTIGRLLVKANTELLWDNAENALSQDEPCADLGDDGRDATALKEFTSAPDSSEEANNSQDGIVTARTSHCCDTDVA